MALLVLASENAENGRVLGRETRAACVTKMQEVGENITMDGNSRFPDYPYFLFLSILWASWVSHHIHIHIRVSFLHWPHLYER